MISIYMHLLLYCCDGSGAAELPIHLADGPVREEAPVVVSKAEDSFPGVCDWS